MKNRFFFCALVIIFLSACQSPQSSKTLSETPVQISTLTPEVTSTQTPTLTLTPTPSVTPTSTLTPTITPTYTPTPLGNSGALVYSACSSSCTGMYSISLNDYQLTRIITSGELISLSPDRNRMIVRDGELIYSMELNEKEKHYLPKAIQEKLNPRILWLPDNERIVYIAHNNKKRDIYISKWDGSDSIKITGADDKPFGLLGFSASAGSTKLYYEMAESPINSNSWKPLGTKWVNIDTGEQGSVSGLDGLSCSVNSDLFVCIEYGKIPILLSSDGSKRIDLLGPNSKNVSTSPPQMIQNYALQPQENRLIVSGLLCNPQCNRAIVYIFSTIDGSLIKQPSVIDGFIQLTGISPDGKLAILFGHANYLFASRPKLLLLNLDDLSITDLTDKMDIPWPRGGGWGGAIDWLPAANP